jgi:hypothetical protein
MAICQNCKREMGCGCNKRTASDGTACCSNCLASYEVSLNGKVKPTVRPQYHKPINVTPSPDSPIITGMHVKIGK